MSFSISLEYIISLLLTMCGVNTKVCDAVVCFVCNGIITDTLQVDYILFLTADVTVTPNQNEVRDYRYVNKEELQAMFEDSCTYIC